MTVMVLSVVLLVTCFSCVLATDTLFKYFGQSKIVFLLCCSVLALYYSIPPFIFLVSKMIIILNYRYWNVFISPLHDYILITACSALVLYYSIPPFIFLVSKYYYYCFVMFVIYLCVYCITVYLRLCVWSVNTILI